jgi:hypothetical protein
LRAKGVASGQTNPIKFASLAGVAIHEAISGEIDVWAAGGTASERRAVAFAISFVDHAWGQRAERISEAKNGLELDPSHVEVCRRIVRSRLERFFEMIWPQFSTMRHESHEKLAEFGGCALRVVVRIDLTCWNPSGELVIVDWKTGGWQNQIGGRVQLAVYALWAVTAHGLPLNSVVPTLVSLQTGEVTRFQPTEYDLGYVRTAIQADSDQVLEYSRRGMFPASPEFDRCWGCPFLSRCPEGKEAMGA